jgi:hypothetical protein
MTTAREQRFLEAFSAAVHDVDLERRGYRIYHFFDSDVLGRLIFGFRDPLNHTLILDSKSQDADSLAGQMLLMGALLGQGIGTPPYLRALAPHLYEVRRAVSRPWSSDPRHSFKLTTDLLEIEDLVSDLIGAVRGEEPDDLLARFLEHGPKIFYGVELLGGEWESRLGRVLRLGIGEPSPFDDAPEILDSPAFDVLVNHVGGVHKDSQPRSSISGVRDAMALATLARHVARGAQTDPPCAARFYTETRRIHNAWRNKDVRELLTYDVRESGLPDLDLGEHGVLRTAEYYLIRALFPELAHPGGTSDEPPVDQVSGVYEIGRDLARATKQLRLGGVSEAELSEFRIGSTTLGQFMNEVTDLSSYRTAGTAWRQLIRTVPQGLPERLLTQLREVLEEGRERAPDLEQSLKSQVKKLDSRTREVARFTQSYVHVHDVLTRWSGALRPRYGSLSNHVGLPRWGFSPDDVNEVALCHLVDSYEEWADEHETPDAPTWRTRFVVELTHQLRDVGSAPLGDPERLGETIALFGFLWLVRDYGSLKECGRELTSGITLKLSQRSTDRERLHAAAADGARWMRVGGAVENLAAVAEVSERVVAMRYGVHDSEADDVVAMTRAVVDGLAEGHRRFPSSHEARAITQGYILFHVWTSFNRTIAASTSQDRMRLRHPALARESLDLCSRALERCDPAGPTYVLLLNHCVYVATVARLTINSLSDLVRQLVGHRPAEGHAWSYRLDDTLGYHYYARAAATTLAHSGDSHLIASARKDLREAERWFDRVPDDVDDPEFVAHRALLRELEVELDAIGTA